MEIKIQVPDDCVLIKNGDTYIIKKEESKPPRSWDEFCKNYPVDKKEHFITSDAYFMHINEKPNRDPIEDRNICTSLEEAKAFLALMQLRQLRKAWVGSWEQPDHSTIISAITHQISDGRVVVMTGNFWNSMALSFPTREMATNFFECFRDLCETAKILL